MISDVVAPIHNCMTGIEKSVQNVENNLGATAGKVLELEDKMKNLVLSGGAGGGGNIDSGHLQKQVDEIKENMKLAENSTDPKIISTTLVVGGMTNFTTLDDASKWLKEILWDAYAPLPIETYVKGKMLLMQVYFAQNFLQLRTVSKV